MKDNYDILREKIEDRLSAPNVEDDGEVISLNTLQETLESAMGNYNSVLVNDACDLAKKMNKQTKLNRTFKKEYPVIESFSPIIEEDGKYYIEVLLADNENRYVGKALIDDKLRISVEFLKNGFSKDKTIELLKTYRLKYLYYFDLLMEFSIKYPNTRYEWNNNYEPSKQKINDGFLVANYNLDELDRTSISFSCLRDSELARTHTKKYGELYDYIIFYQGRIMRRTSVNINDLNDLYQTIVRKELGLNKSSSLKRVK